MLRGCLKILSKYTNEMLSTKDGQMFGIHKSSSRGDKTWIPTPCTWSASNKKQTYSTSSTSTAIHISICVSISKSCLFSAVLPLSSSVVAVLYLASFKVCMQRSTASCAILTVNQCGFSLVIQLIEEISLKNLLLEYSLEYRCNSYWDLWQEHNWLAGSSSHKVTS